MHAFSELTTKISMKIDAYYQRQRCSTMTVVFLAIGLCGYSRRFLEDEASNDSRSGNQKRGFSGLSNATYVFETLGNEANIIIYYYLVPCRFSTDPKIHDLE